MSWRAILTGTDSRAPSAEYALSAKSVQAANTADCAETAYREHEEISQTTILTLEPPDCLQAFTDLVRLTAACEHHVLLHRDEIAAQLEDADAADLANTTREARQAWAVALAKRLARARIDPSWRRWN